MSNVPEIRIQGDGERGFSWSIAGTAGMTLCFSWRKFKTQAKCFAAVERLHRRLTSGNLWRVTFPTIYRAGRKPETLQDTYLRF